MARQNKQKGRRTSDIPRRARKLRSAECESQEDIRKLEEFFVDRDEYIRRHGARISDYMELSPMPQCYRWTRDPAYETPDEIKTPADRARAKHARRKAAERLSK